jgi:peptidyl-prolyl cis-trans isomerase D
MLQQLRTASKSWVATVIIGALVLAFALWGVADIFRGTTDNTVADIGEMKIAASDFNSELTNQIRSVGQQAGLDLTLEQARTLGLDRSVLDNMISRVAMDLETRKLGLAGSDASVAKEIRNLEVFHGSGGSFDRATYDRVLQSAGLTEAYFVAGMRGDLMRGQLINSSGDAIIAPQGMAVLLAEYQNEQRTAAYLELTESDSGTASEPTDAELAAYHKAHAANFSTPEYREIDYVVFGPETIANSIKVTDEEIRKAYDAKKASYDTLEQRTIEQIVFPSEAAAKEASQKIASGTSFLDIAKAQGLAEADIALGTFTADKLDAKLSPAAFAAPEGGVTTPVQGSFGWALLHVSKITPGSTKTFDQVKDQVRADVVKDKATTRVAEIANSFEDARASGATLMKAAERVGIPSHHVASIDHNGVDADGKLVDSPQEGMTVLQLAFATESGEESDLATPSKTHYVAVRVDGIKPPALKPLDAVKDKVREGFLAEQRKTQLKKRADELGNAAKKAGNLTEAAATLGREPMASMASKRGAATEAFSADLVNAIFDVPKGQVVTGMSADGKKYIFAQVTDVQHPPIDTSSQEFTTSHQQLSSQLGQDLADSFAMAARGKAGVTIHQAVVDRVTGAGTSK